MVCMGQVWGIGKRLFRGEFKIRMFLFDCLVDGIMTYGAEIFRWKGREEELERVQRTYIKWCLKLDRTTSEYMVLGETMREKVRIRAGEKALRFEEKVERTEGRGLVKECVRERVKVWEIKRNSKERTEYLNSNEYSQAGIEEQRREGKETIEIIGDSEGAG
ncbi:uncharacterized protein LOC143211707 [Lasioglossum baleicum]|uniref:uncharacterized protein LOC143211707 n=1 Tax=Lasioglossum baleicum TaxID=434251 RepID=UPI003FCC864E